MNVPDPLDPEYAEQLLDAAIGTYAASGSDDDGADAVQVRVPARPNAPGSLNAGATAAKSE